MAEWDPLRLRGALRLPTEREHMAHTPLVQAEADSERRTMAFRQGKLSRGVVCGPADGRHGYPSFSVACGEEVVAGRSVDVLCRWAAKKIPISRRCARRWLRWTRLMFPRGIPTGCRTASPPRTTGGFDTRSLDERRKRVAIG